PATTPATEAPATAPAEPQAPVAPVTPAPLPVVPGAGDTPILAPIEEDVVNLAEHVDVIVDNTLIAAVNPFIPAGNTSSTQWTYTLIYDRLIEDIGGGAYGPMLATDWHTDDYILWIFNLRDDVVFHNGDRFTAEHVAGTIRIAQESLGTIGGDRWAIVESYNIPDDFTIEITLRDVHVDFLFDISSPPAGIINEAAFRADPEEGSWIGTGPFQIVNFSTNDFVTVERFDDFWGEAPPSRFITLRFVPEVATRLVMLQNRESHLCFSISPEDLTYVLAHDPDFQIIQAMFNAPNVIGFNMADPLMADPNFRRAVFHAVNLEEIAMVAAGEWAVAPQDGNVWGPSTPYRVETIPRWEFNPDLARQYLEASIYAGEVVEISATVATNIRAAEIIQHQLRQIGLETSVNSMDTPSFLAHVRFGDNPSQMHVFAASFTLSPIGSVWNVYYPGTGNNRTNFNNPFISDIITRVRVETDSNVRRELLTELQEYIAADPPYINLFWRLNGVAAINGLGGLQLSHDSLRYNMRGLFIDLDIAPM
ncbi:MAG: ABC transporter substrate-binding protein, partial [Oscillospiraceae bacterium]|nr:ABC transporter substrate-binding protein [Oscillospiraceae bacterium]